MLDRKPAQPCATRACRPAPARKAATRRTAPVPGEELRAAAERHGLALRSRAVVAPANDPAEAAADALAARALAGPATGDARHQAVRPAAASGGAPGPTVRPAAASDGAPGPTVRPAPPRCSCGGTPGPDGECSACRTKRLRKQAAARAPVVAETLGAPGRPLDAVTRSFFEPRLGSDLSRVRVHTGERAAGTAASLGARAFAVGSEVVFGAGEYAPQTPAGQRLLAHELAHVVQDGGGPPVVRRLVHERNVSCRRTGLHHGVPGGVITGPDAVATIQAADARAIELASRAEAALFLNRVMAGTLFHVPDATFDTALMNRFGLAVTNAADRPTIAIIEREIAAVRRFLESGYVRYICRDAECSGEWASAIPGERVIRLCNPFWNSTSVNQQGATILHEALHLWWDQIYDQGRRPLHNAHCFEQFALDVAGATAEILPEFVGSCVV
jgi:hypothetical protein